MPNRQQAATMETATSRSGSGRTEKKASDLWKESLEEDGYDFTTGTVRVKLPPNVFQLIRALAGMTNRDASELMSEFLVGDLKGFITGHLDPDVVRAIKRAYFSGPEAKDITAS